MKIFLHAFFKEKRLFPVAVYKIAVFSIHHSLKGETSRMG
jgi:hypothetical protein